MAKSMTEIYLDALKAINGWATVSEWATKVGELYPDVLEKAEKEARAYATPSTGLREIAARISSAISRNAYQGQVELDERERPRKIRILTEAEAKAHEEKELEEDLAPITRGQKIKSDFEKLSVKEKYRADEFYAIVDQLRAYFNLTFEVDHAKALQNKTSPGQHHPDNLQILLKAHNGMKNNENWERFSFNEQTDYIKSAVVLQRMIAKRTGIEIDDTVIESILQRLKAVY